MDFKDIYFTYWSISKEEMLQIFPFMDEVVFPAEKPKTKRGRKPKAHRAPQCEVEMKQA